MRLNKTHHWVILAMAVLLFHPSVAQPCGLCHEDDLASVYTYAAEQKVKANPETLEFVVLKVAGPLLEKTAEKLKNWLTKIEGIDAATVVVSVTQRAVGFVLEKRIVKERLLSNMATAFSELTFQKRPYNLVEHPHENKSHP